MAGVYIHIPFCKKKCPYCDFLSYTNCDSNKIEAVLSAIEKEIELWAKSPQIKSLTFSTIYIGGGTPSLVEERYLKRIVKKARSFLHFTKDIEFSIEANPESLTHSWLESLVELGLTRISIGVQDLTEKGLKVLGRIHTYKDALSAIELAKSFKNLDTSVDIIYNWPGQNLKDLETSLSLLLALSPQHISAYELNIEPKTRFYALYKRGRLLLQKEDKAEEIYNYLLEALRKQGFNRYEISNFSLPNHECVHNINYWENGPYLGIGPGAVSFLPPVRGKNPSSLTKYLKGVESSNVPFWAEREELDNEARFRESVVLALRMMKGFNVSYMEKKWGFNAFKYYGNKIFMLCDYGLLKVDNDQIFLSQKGIRLSNLVFRELV